MKNKEPKQYKLGKYLTLYPGFSENSDLSARCYLDYYNGKWTWNIIVTFSLILMMMSFIFTFTHSIYWLIPAIFCLFKPFCKLYIRLPFKYKYDAEDNDNYLYGISTLKYEKCIILGWGLRKSFIPSISSEVIFRITTKALDNTIIELSDEKSESKIKKSYCQLYDFSQNTHIHLSYYVETIYLKYYYLKWLPYVFSNIKTYRLNIDFLNPDGFNFTRGAHKATLSMSCPTTGESRADIEKTLIDISEQTRFNDYSNFSYICYDSAR